MQGISASFIDGLLIYIAGLALDQVMSNYVITFLSIIPKSCYVEPDQVFTTWHLCTVGLGIFERRVLIIQVVDLRYQVKIISRKKLERVATCRELNTK